MRTNFMKFYVASLSILLLASIVALPMPTFAQNPDSSKSPLVIVFKDKVSQKQKDIVSSVGGEITRTYTIINGVAANIPSHALEKLQNNPSILTVDPDIEFHALEQDANIRIGADQVWSHSTPSTGNGVKVAILDTGIDTSHPEFINPDRILNCTSEITSENYCDDQHGHGTHVAGIVGATGVDAAAKGAAYDVSFLVSKVLSKSGSGSLSGIISGMEWAVANDADIISMSLGTSPYSNQTLANCDDWYSSMTTAVNNAVSAGVSVVAAAGNDGTGGVGLPACISNTIAVAAVNDSDVLASFSSVGGAVEDHGISAPGVGIYSSLPGNDYASWSGTSMATPVVSGTIALLLQANSNLSPADVKNALFSTACTQNTSPSCSSIPSTPNISYGHGRVNAIAAYDLVLGTPVAPPEDNDKDNFTSDIDCNDNDPEINPGAEEIPDDDVDQNCDGVDKRKIHVNNLSSSISGKKNMNVQVTVTVLDSQTSGRPVAGVTVSGDWTGDYTGSTSCVTDSSGECSVSQNTKGNTLTFTVINLSMSSDYELGSNQATSITINRGDSGGDDGGDGGSGPSCPPNSNKPQCR